MKKIYALTLLAALLFTACSENYSNGKRVGYLVKFSKKGWVCDTWEGTLNQSQTGMTSTVSFDFSVDRDNKNQALIDSMQSALDNGFKIEVEYHQVKGWNWWHNRGETSYFVTGVRVRK